MHELNEDPVRVRLHLGRRDPALDYTAERGEMCLEDPLGLVLRQAALEMTAAVDVIETRSADNRHVRAVHAGTPDVLGGIEERWQQADGIEDLEGAGLNRRGARLTVRLNLSLDEPRFHAVASEFGSGK
jgi:hypothetical protein